MKKYRELNFNEFLFNKDHFIYKVDEDDNRIIIHLKSRLHACKCPKCGFPSKRTSSTYHRTLQDTPIHNKPTYLDIDAYKYYCLNPQCSQTIFAEPLSFSRPFQERTNALNLFIIGISIFLSNNSASHILSLIGVKVSKDSITRLYERINFHDNLNVKSVGIDDVSIKKGNSYMTVVYDLQDHHLIALLKGRDGVELKKWLKIHNKINLIARDRDSAYSKAIRETLPKATQVADRFHLANSLLKYMKPLLEENLPKNFFIKNNQVLNKQPSKIKINEDPPLEDPEIMKTLHYDNEVPIDKEGSHIEVNGKWGIGGSVVKMKYAEKRKKKQNLIRTIQSVHLQNPMTDKELSKKFDISIGRVHKYLKLTPDEINNIGVHNRDKRQNTLVNNYKNLIFKMMRDGLSDSVIYLYIVSKGYDINKSSLLSYIYKISVNNFPERKTIGNSFRVSKKTLPKDVTLIKRRPVIKNVFTIDSKEDNEFQLIAEKYPMIREVKSIFKDFHTVLMGKEPSALDIFLKKYQYSIISGFCGRIKKDIASVYNAISMKTSSGFVEGNNNKLKLMERILYGRSEIVNLYAKSYIAFMETSNKFDFSQLISDNLL